MKQENFKQAVELDNKIRTYKNCISNAQKVIDTNDVCWHVSIEVPYEVSKEIAKMIAYELSKGLAGLEDEFNKL